MLEDSFAVLTVMLVTPEGTVNVFAVLSQLSPGTDVSSVGSLLPRSVVPLYASTTPPGAPVKYAERVYVFPGVTDTVCAAYPPAFSLRLHRPVCGTPPYMVVPVPETVH